MEARVLLHDVKGEGEPIVLVPGGLTGWLSWIPHQERLAAARRAIRVQPIHNELGSRGETPDPTYDDVVERESLRMTLDELGVEVADLAGWSGGARALIEFALEYPGRVRTLTLVEPPARWVAYQSGAEIDEETRRGDAFIESLGGRAVDEDDLATFLRLAGFAEEGADPRQDPRWPNWLPHRQALAAQYLLGRSERSLDEVAAFGRPVLLVKGARSSAWLRGIVDVLGASFPNATPLELDGTHACHIERIDEFMTALEHHLAGANRGLTVG